VETLFAIDISPLAEPSMGDIVSYLQWCLWKYVVTFGTLYRCNCL